MKRALVIFSDLDGTILDRKSFQPGPARRAIEKCQMLNIPIILVSGKTRREIEEIRARLNIREPFISENGGGLFVPAAQVASFKNAVKSGPYWCISDSVSMDVLRHTLYTAAAKLNLQVEGFGNMSLKRVTAITGLNLRQAALARLREFDEPFIILDETSEKRELLKAEILGMGYRYNFGGSLHHITGDFDKGERMSQLQEWYREINPDIRFAAIGDAYNDLPMLQRADYPYLVGKQDETMQANLHCSRLRVTRAMGPAGFAEALDDLLG